jgi:hypothetical protein
MAHRRLGNFRLTRPHGADDEEYITLPKIADYVEHHMDHDVLVGMEQQEIKVKHRNHISGERRVKRE